MPPNCSEKKCPVGKVCNPKTGRCILVKSSRKTSTRSKKF